MDWLDVYDAAVLPVGKVTNGGGVGQGDVFEVAQDIVGVLGGLPVFGFALQFAVGGVTVGDFTQGGGAKQVV
ncbi:hypothetical protein [Methylovulum psychrotolerans]|uniref:hypothetical protein n=1 Tax=Methylovulum psychrotolerans TaxID=1704499 RepID=UPI001E5E873A|nr:hypothetical protein [Methylovulum psychrotolerans]